MEKKNNQTMKKVSNIKNISLKQFAKKHFYNSADSNVKIAVTIAIGIFASILPIWGLQSIAAVSIAMLFRLNKLIAYAVSNFSQPPLTPVIIFFSYILGGIIISNGKTDISFSTQFNLERVEAHFYQYIIGSVILAVVLAIVVGTVAYIALLFFRKRKSEMLNDKEEVLCT
jgi:uncharacterized protein (DUF2062 family)